MPAIKLDAIELKEVLELTPAGQNILLIGKHGIGKSRIIQDFYQEKNERVVAFFLGQMSDPGDLIGLPHKDEVNGRTEFLPPNWWPTDDVAIVLFLDELNRARPEILQAVMDLTLNRKLAGKSLPEGSRVVAAVNEGDEYQLTDLDPALLSRFNIYEFAPTIEDWLVWAHRAKVDPRVIQFIQHHRDFLDGDRKPHDPNSAWTAEIARSPDRRSWERVSNAIHRIVKLEEVHIKLIAGMIGASAAVHFSKFTRESSELTADDVLFHFDKCVHPLSTMQTHDFAALNERLVMRVQQGQFTVPQKKKALKNFDNYMDFLIRKGQSESCAHLASLLERKRFRQAAEFLMADTSILNRMVEFIQQID